MCGPAAPIIMAAAAVAGAGASIYGAVKSNENQKKAMVQSEHAAADQQASNERAYNSANQKKPNLASLFNLNQGINSGGAGSTMLTGPSGSPISGSILGANSLLGR